MDEIKIRYAGLEDAALLSELGKITFLDAFGSQNTPENMAAYLSESFSVEKQRDEINQPGSLFLIAEIHGEPAGYARLLAGSTETCITGGNPIELVRIYAAPKWIGKGVGGRLMEACIQEAQDRGHDILWLGVWQKNDRAIAFYHKWGFQEACTHTFWLGDDKQVDWIMQQPLPIAFDNQSYQKHNNH